MDQSHTSPPSLVALFLVVFDQRIGFQLAWSSTASSHPALSLDGVEYKSLPSGLHGVPSDLVYFRHSQFAGISAFQRGEGDAAHRNADFVSVGALVEVGQGRLGRAWEHAEGLKGLAGSISGLEERLAEGKGFLKAYWEAWRADKEEGGKAGMIRPDRRGRARSDASNVVKNEGLLGADHPALDMGALAEVFGPLVFPLYKAALCRKRILLMGSAPVQQSCNFVYDLSVLSSIPQSAAETLEASLEHLFRIQPLFSVGIHDIPELQSRARAENRQSMLACTTDDILQMKNDLYDIVVELPAASSHNNSGRWPRIRTSEGRIIKATQRDFKRFKTLNREMRRTRSGRRRDTMRYRDDESGSDDQEDDDQPLLQNRRRSVYPEDGGIEGDEYETVEPASWTTAACQTFMWWASAGERDSIEAEEQAMDQELLANLPEAGDSRVKSPFAPSSEVDDHSDTEEKRFMATALTAYFHRLTFMIISNLASIVEEADDSTEEGIEEGSILIRAEEVRRLGLDVWSESDKEFVRDIVQLYFDRNAVIESGGITLCGMRVC